MSGLLALTTPQEYFRDLLSDAINHQQIRVQPDTEFYLVNLLSQFLKSERLFTDRDDGGRDTEPLALMMARALEGPREVQVKTLRKLGDTSLYVSGFFADSLQKSLVDIDYYIQMGGAAYAKVAELTRVDGLAALYAELSERFKALVDVLAEVAEATAVVSNLDVVRLYERWMKTGSVRLARRLGEQGVVAQVVPPKSGLKQ